MNVHAAKAFANPPPAIVQEVKDIAYFRRHLKEQAQNLKRNAKAYRELVKEFKDSEVWKLLYKTWGEACRCELEITPQHAHRLLTELTEMYQEDDHGGRDHKATADRTDTLNKLADLPAPPREDPPEKPAVQAATPEQMKPKPHSENGKPKHLLAIWRELEESHFGRALNRIDELNRQCPNAKFHVELIAADKRCLAILDQWKQHITHA